MCFRFEGRSTIPIEEGEILNVSYTYTLSGTKERQRHLEKGKFFKCICKRCVDPTELGTHFSSLKCQKCQSGNVLSSDPLSNVLCIIID